MEELRSFLATYGYPALFLGVLAENAGIPVPGETAVLFSGFLASEAGGAHFKLHWVIVVTIVAAVIGDNIGFWLGYRYARKFLLQGRRFLFITPKMLAVAENYFQRFGLWTIFFQRFITGVRVFGAIAAGTADMQWTRFFIANVAGAAAWSVTMGLLGYFFGKSLDLMEKWLGRTGGILLACVVAAIVIAVLYRRLHKRNGATSAATALAAPAPAPVAVQDSPPAAQR